MTVLSAEQRMPTQRSAVTHINAVPEGFVPRPSDAFVRDHITPIDLRAALSKAVMDIDVTEQERRIAYAMSLGLPNAALLRDVAPPGARVMICGGGPSLAANVLKIREAQANGWVIIALNITHDWLLARGIRPNFAIMLDPAPRVAGYQTPTKGVTYLIGSTVHASVWQRFREAGVRPFWWVPIGDDTQHSVIMRRFPGVAALFVAGATTVGLRALNLARFMGWQTLDLVGYDSCYAPDAVEGEYGLYPYPKPHIHHDRRECTAVSRATMQKFTYITNGSMARQVLGFQSILESMPNTETNGRVGGVRLIVHGDGVIPWMAWKDGGPDKLMEHADPAAMAAKYGDAYVWDYAKGKAI